MEEAYIAEYETIRAFVHAELLEILPRVIVEIILEAAADTEEHTIIAKELAFLRSRCTARWKSGDSLEIHVVEGYGTQVHFSVKFATSDLSKPITLQVHEYVLGDKDLLRHHRPTQYFSDTRALLAFFIGQSNTVIHRITLTRVQCAAGKEHY